MDKLKINYTSKNNSSLILEGQNIILVSSENVDLLPQDTFSIRTDISLYFTDKCSAILTNVEHQARNKILLPSAGLILRGVCEDITITLTNFNSMPYKIKAGKTRIATLQLIGSLTLKKIITLEGTAVD